MKHKSKYSMLLKQFDTASLTYKQEIYDALLGQIEELEQVADLMSSQLKDV